MRILHINWSGKLGGAEKFVYTLAKYQCNGVFQCVPTIAYMNKKLTLGKRAEEQGIKVVEFNMGSGFDIINFVKYVSFIKRERFNVIHDHNGPPIVRLSKLFSPGSVFIQHIHGTKFGNRQWERLRVKLWKLATRWLVDHYIANSGHTKKMASTKEKIPLDCISIVYNGVDLSEFAPLNREAIITIRNELGIKESDYVIGTVANLTPAKGIDKFIYVANEIKGAKFVIVGDGELRGELEQLVEGLELTHRVLFTGTREDVRNVLATFDMFLLTSNWEAFGISLIEAMSAGIPVVAFRVDGIPEVVDEGCGMLIPPKVEEAVKSVAFLVTNPGVAKNLAQNGLQLVNSKFDIQKIAKQISTVYKKTLQE